MFRDECTKDKFKFQYPVIEDFTRCFWQKQLQVSGIWLAYRAVLCLYFDTAVFVLLVYTEDDCVWYKNGIYYTFWSYCVEMVAFTLAFGITVEKFIQDRKNSAPNPRPSPSPKELLPSTPKDVLASNPKDRSKPRESPPENPNPRPNSRERPMSPETPPDVLTLRYKVLWITYTMAAASAGVVTTIFFLFVYTQEVSATLIYTLIAHVSNTACMAVDFFLGAIPIRFLHFYIPMVFALIYALFTGIYQGCGGTGEKGQIPIYSMLDWRDPKVAFSTLAVQMTCILLLHCGYCILGLLKLWLKGLRETD